MTALVSGAYLRCAHNRSPIGWRRSFSVAIGRSRSRNVWTCLRTFGESCGVLRAGGPMTQDPDIASELPTVARAVWHVMRKRDMRHFGRVLEFLEVVNEQAPGVLCFRHHAKLSLGVKGKMVLDMVEKSRPLIDILAALNHHFPSAHPHDPHATRRDLFKVHQSSSHFRRLILRMIRDDKFRWDYVERRLQEDYGESFMVALERLLWELLHRLQEILDHKNLSSGSRFTSHSRRNQRATQIQVSTRSYGRAREDSARKSIPPYLSLYTEVTDRVNKTLASPPGAEDENVSPVAESWQHSAVHDVSGLPGVTCPEEPAGSEKRGDASPPSSAGQQKRDQASQAPRASRWRPVDPKNVGKSGYASGAESPSDKAADGRRAELNVRRSGNPDGDHVGKTPAVFDIFGWDCSEELLVNPKRPSPPDPFQSQNLEVLGGKQCMPNLSQDDASTTQDIEMRMHPGRHGLRSERSKLVYTKERGHRVPQVSEMEQRKRRADSSVAGAGPDAQTPSRSVGGRKRYNL